jgi:hypothetical protein
MSQVNMQKEILDTLTGLKQDVSHLKSDMHHVMEYLEDTRLTPEEKQLVDQSIAKAKAGDTSGLTSHEDLKKELGL